MRIALALVAIGAFVAFFDYSPRIVASHLVLVGLWALTETALLGFAAAATARRLGRLLLTLIPTVSVCALLLLYAVDVLTNWMFGQNATLAFLLTYAREWRGLLASVPSSAAPWALLALPLLAGLWSLHRHWATRILAGLPTAPRAGLRLRIVAAAAALALVHAGAATALRHRMQIDDAERWIGEPLSNLVLLDRWMSFADDPERAARMEREAELARRYPAGPPGRGDNVILILVDSLRADHLPMYGYPRNTAPFLNRLYETGKLERVEWAFSSCSESFCGILSTLSSKEYPALTRRDFRLPDLLHKRGYAVHFLLAGDHDWFGLRDAYGDHVDHLRHGAQEPAFGAFDDRVVLDGLDELPAWDRRPHFFFLFLMSAHVMTDKEERFRVYRPQQASIQWGSVVHGEYDLQPIRNRHDNGIRQADHYIAEAFRRLDEKGYLERALVLISADHGDGLGEKGYYGHTYNLFNEDIRVPLLVYSSSGLRLANRDFASQIDVAPTLVDALGLPIPETWQGRSLLAGEARTASRHHTPRNHRCQAVLLREAGEIWKYLRCTEPLPGRGDEMVYALRADPAEEQNLLHELPDAFVTRLGRLMAGDAPSQGIGH